MKNILAIILSLFFATAASAQTSPNLHQGQVLTPAQWNQLFINKQDTLGFTPFNPSGGTITGRLVTSSVPNGTNAGFNMTPGSTPPAPTDGDLWTTSAGLFVRINGTTLGPLGTLACPTCVVSNATNTFTAYQIMNLNATTIPAAQTGTVLQIGQADTVASRVEQDSFAASSFFTGVRANGTNASPTTLLLDDSIVSFNAWGYDGTTRSGPAVSVRLFSGGTWSGTSHPGYMDFATTAVGSTTLTSRMRVEANGGITIGGAASAGAGNLNVSGSVFNNGTAPVGSSGGYVLSNAPALVSPTANTLALGGAAIGGNALAVTGSAAFSSSVTMLSQILLGSTSGNLTITCAAACGTSQIKFPNGTTDFSATGGTNQVLMQTSSGGPLTVGQVNFTNLAGTIAAGQFSTGPGIVTLAMLNNAAAATIVGNATAGSAARTDVSITALTDITTPNATLDWLLIQNHTTGTLQKTNASELLSVAGAGVTSLNTQSGVVTLLTSPQGRLTLQSGVPVMSTSQSNKTQIFYDCYGNNQVPYYTGSVDALDTIAACEVSTTMVSAASAGQTVAGQVYDIWWVHGGANRLCIAMSASTGGGGGWASDGGSATARGTGYSQLDFLTRPYVTNKNSITNCFNGATNYGPVSANQGTYLGTMYATANGQTTFQFGSNNTGTAQAGIFALWNMYNRQLIKSTLSESVNWTYGSAVYRNANASTGNRFVFVIGVPGDGVETGYMGGFGTYNGTTSAQTENGIGLDWTTGTPDKLVFGQTQVAGLSTYYYENVPMTYNNLSGLHYIQAVEWGNSLGTDNHFGGINMAFNFSTRM